MFFQKKHLGWMIANKKILRAQLQGHARVAWAWALTKWVGRANLTC